MASTTRSTPRTGARLGRTSPSSSAGRFSRPGTSAPRRRRTTTTTSSRIPARLGRASSPKGKRQQGIGGMLAGILPARAAAKATPSSKRGKAGGAALLAAAAGMAFRNREKLTAMLDRRRSGAAEQETPTTSPVPRPAQSASTPGV